MRKLNRLALPLDSAVMSLLPYFPWQSARSCIDPAQALSKEIEATEIE